MDSSRCRIGLDIGTTSVKAVALDDHNRELARCSNTIELIVDDEGRAEQDATHVYEVVVETLATVCRDVLQRGASIQGVACSAAMHSVLPVDESGKSLDRAMTWVDARAGAVADEVWATDEGKATYERTGTPIHAMTPVVKLIWLARQRGDLFGRAVRFVSLKEWVWYQWFGEWQVDRAIASASGLYNVHQREWDPGALHLAGISADHLSVVVPTTYSRTGILESRLLAAGLNQQTVFTIGASDGVLANLGVGATTSETMVFTVGTSSAVRVGSSEAVTDRSTRAFCYVLDDGRYVLGGPSNSGGIALDWVVRQISSLEEQSSNGENFTKLLDEAGLVETGDLVCLPYVAGERAPLWTSDARAAFVGISLSHHRGHLIRATVEGIVYNAYWIAETLIRRIGTPTTLVASGKLFASHWVQQLVADVFGVPVRVGETVDASVIGAVTLSRLADGSWSWTDVDQLVITSAPIYPRVSERAKRQAQFHRFKTIARQILNV